MLKSRGVKENVAVVDECVCVCVYLYILYVGVKLVYRDSLNRQGREGRKRCGSHHPSLFLELNQERCTTEQTAIYFHPTVSRRIQYHEYHISNMRGRDSERVTVTHLVIFTMSFHPHSHI